MTTPLAGGCLCGAIRYTLTAHIWTASARPWAHMDPATGQHPGNPPG